MKKINIKCKINLVVPYIGFIISVLEYLLIPNVRENKFVYRYVILLIVPLFIYTILLIIANIKKEHNDKLLKALIFKAPFMCGIYILLAFFDILTLKTGYLTYPFIPWVNDIINAAIADLPMLIKSSLFSMRLLFLGYFAGAIIGLITGIFCGYSEKVRYWVEPLLNILGPIPTATWLPLVMILASSTFTGSIFVIGLGTWYSVSVASAIGIRNVKKEYLDVAKILGAKENQLIFKVAIPAALPNIFQGLTVGMSSACISLMIAEMMGVEAGLGWYIDWAKAWAMFNRMFAAIVVICVLFNLVNFTLTKIKNYVLRWQDKK